MASYNAYYSQMTERKLTIDSFSGIDQSRGNYSGDYGSSPYAKNFRTRNGILSTVGGISEYGSPIPVETVNLYPYRTSFPASTTYPVNVDGTSLINHCRLFQGFFRDAQGNDFSRLIATVYGRIFVADINAGTWSMIAEHQTSNDWTAVNYRDETRDWIIFTNGVDTPLYWDGISNAAEELEIIQGAEPPSTGEELRFQNITLLNERLWGGVTPAYPDRIYWSNTFDPEDWEFNWEDSENEGGGYLDVATFDGSRIRAVFTAMDEILVFKDKSLHRITGSYPGEFTLSQIFGTEGTLAYRTIVTNGSSLYFLSTDGLVRYTGMSAIPLSASGDKKLKDIWARINPSTINYSCATMMDNIIYLSVPLDGSIINTHVIEYDTTTGNYNIIELSGIDDWLILREGQQETLLVMSGGSIFRYDSGYTFHDGTPINAVWLSPCINCGTLSSKKQTGRFYLSVSATSLDVERQPQIKITLLSGAKSRFKLIKLKPGINEIRKRVKIRGRSFQFMIENVNGDPLTINSGAEIHIEEDFD